MKRRRGGFSLIHVLVTGALLATAAGAWQASFHAMHARALRGQERARARAVAQAAWERARAALVAGRDPTAPAGTRVLDGEAATRVEGAAGGARRVVIDALVRRRDGEPVRTRLIMTLDERGAVTGREEVGA